MNVVDGVLNFCNCLPKIWSIDEIASLQALAPSRYSRESRP